MKILIISFSFPPYNSIGALRVGKTAKYLTLFGHQVRVISAKDQALPLGLECEIPDSWVEHTRWIDVNAPVHGLLGGRVRVASQGYATEGPGKGILARLGRVYRDIVNFPDGRIGWYPFALRAGIRMARDWSPDVIYASSAPPTSLLVAAQISARTHIPWVGELRDLWCDNHYRECGPVRQRLEEHLERRVLESALGLITVSEPLAKTLEAKHDPPVGVVLNGYDPIDGEGEDTTAVLPTDRLNIIHTGTIYAGKRDPSPLFEAVRALGDKGERIHVTFVGRVLGDVKALAERYGLEPQVSTLRAVPYRTALAMQRAADVLLLLLWNDPREKGVYTGKLFEYIGAGRPILAVGNTDTAAAQLVMQEGFGFAAANCDDIARQLDRWLREKDEGTLLSVSHRSVARFTREYQTRVFESLLEQWLAAAR